MKNRIIYQIHTIITTNGCARNQWSCWRQCIICTQFFVACLDSLSWYSVGFKLFSFWNWAFKLFWAWLISASLSLSPIMICSVSIYCYFDCTCTYCVVNSTRVLDSSEQEVLILLLTCNWLQNFSRIFIHIWGPSLSSSYDTECTLNPALSEFLYNPCPL